ncbi:MAG: DUF1456 family protein [Deferribacterales bacterium]
MRNNDIIKKLRIALEMKDTDIIEIFALGGANVTKSEISAFFRREDHRNYQALGDQLMRRFMNGLTKKYRGENV